MTCEDRVKELEAEVISLNRQLADVTTELGNAHSELNKAWKARNFAQNQLNADKKKDSPQNAEVRGILEYWIVACKKRTNTKIPLDGGRADRVRWALKHFTADEVRQAIDGLAAYRYVWDRRGRQRFGTSDQKSDDITACLFNEKTVEKFMDLARKPEPEGTVEVPQKALDAMRERVVVAEYLARQERAFADQQFEATNKAYELLAAMQEGRPRLRIVDAA